MKKLITLLLIFLFIFSITGCKSNEVKPPTTDTVTTEKKGPDTIIDPGNLDWGYDKENNKYERWYLQGTDDVIYIYFLENDDNTSLCTYNLVKSGVVKESYSLTKTDDNHLVDDAKNIDLVFSDAFNCYDYITDSYYKRGNIEEVMASFNNVTFEIKDNEKNNIVFKEDGTFKKTIDETVTSGKWEIVSKNNLRCTNDDNTVDIYKILYNADEYVTTIKFNEQTFFTTYIAEENQYR